MSKAGHIEPAQDREGDAHEGGWYDEEDRAAQKSKKDIGGKVVVFECFLLIFATPDRKSS